jgi:predicted transcriptional regulator
MLHGTQQDFPVVDEGRLVGILTRSELLSGLSQSGPDMLVSQVMRKEYPTVSSTEMLQAAFDKLQSPGCRALLIMENGNLRGLFTVENMAEFLMVQSALSGAGKKAAPVSQNPDSADRQGLPKLIVRY